MKHGSLCLEHWNKLMFFTNKRKVHHKWIKYPGLERSVISSEFIMPKTFLLSVFSYIVRFIV